MLNIVFVLVSISTLVQAPSLPAAARLLRLDQLRDMEVETAPLDVLDADLPTIITPAGSRT